MEVDINIWDDYHEDGYVPEGEVQETYIYVEDVFTLVQEQEALMVLCGYLQHKYDWVEFKMEMRDSRKEYPHMNWEEIGMKPIIRWEIKVKNMTHEVREKIVDAEKGLILGMFKYRIYSES